MKNTLIFTHRTNILVRLLTVSTKNCLTRDPILSNYWKCDPILVNPVVKMRPLLASYKEVPPGIIFSTKEKCLDDLTECSSRKTSVTGQFIASWTLRRPVLISPSTRKLNSTREVLWSRVWDSDCYNQAREKVQDAKVSSPPPLMTPSSCPPPPQNKTVLVKNVPP